MNLIIYVSILWLLMGVLISIVG